MNWRILQQKCALWKLWFWEEGVLKIQKGLLSEIFSWTALNLKVILTYILWYEKVKKHTVAVHIQKKFRENPYLLGADLIQMLEFKDVIDL